MPVNTRPERLFRKRWVFRGKTVVTKEGHVKLMTSTACAIAVCAVLTAGAYANPRIKFTSTTESLRPEQAARIIEIAESSAARRSNAQARRKALDARRAGRSAERARRNSQRSNTNTRSPFRNPRPQLNEVLRSNRAAPTASDRASREAARARSQARDADRRARRDSRRAAEAERRRQRTRILRDEQFRRQGRRK